MPRIMEFNCICTLQIKWENIPEASMDYLLNNLSSAVTADGLAAQNEYMTQFVLMPKVNVASKSIITNTQTQVVLNMDISLQVVDGMSGTLYASSTVNVKGVGTTKRKHITMLLLNK